MCLLTCLVFIPSLQAPSFSTKFLKILTSNGIRDTYELCRQYKITEYYVNSIRQSLYYLSWINPTVKLNIGAWIYFLFQTSIYSYQHLNWIEYVFFGIPAFVHLLFIFFQGASWGAFVLFFSLFTGYVTYCRLICLRLWAESLFRRGMFRDQNVLSFYSSFVSISGDF